MTARRRTALQESPFDRPADRVLEAARRLWPGSEAYRADPDKLGTWYLRCPCCRSEHLALALRESGEEPGGPITLSCEMGCTEAAIRSALGLDLPPSIDPAQRL